MDKFNKRLWLRPMLPTENAGKLAKAPLFSPGNWGTMDYFETEKGKTQKLRVYFDSAMEVKELCLKNIDGQDAIVTVKDVAGAPIACTTTKSGTGLDCITKLTFATPLSITSSGVFIGVNTETPPGVLSPFARKNIEKLFQIHFKGNVFQVDFSMEQTQTAAIDIYSVAGAKVTTIPLGVKAKGLYSISRSLNLAGGYYMFRFRNGNKIVATCAAMLSR
jgi:hypothetical protein